MPRSTYSVTRTANGNNGYGNNGNNGYGHEDCVVNGNGDNISPLRCRRMNE